MPVGASCNWRGFLDAQSWEAAPVVSVADCRLGLEVRSAMFSDLQVTGHHWCCGIRT
jgi:hypothetical protein